MLSETIVIAVLTAAPATIAAIAGLVNAVKLTDVHHAVNSEAHHQRQELRALRAALSEAALEITQLKVELAKRH